MAMLALVTYVLIALYALAWCENQYHDNLPVYKAGGSTKREALQSGRLSKAGGSTKRGRLASDS